MLIREKGNLNEDNSKRFTLENVKCLLRWKHIQPASGVKKQELVDACMAAPKPKIQKVWCRSEEAELQRLKETKVPMEDTATGVATTQMARAVTNNLAQLDPEALESLKAAIHDLEESKGDNVI